MFWGLTPALDLQDEYKKHNKPLTELNILIVGGADARHILKTIGESYRHEPVKINFYVMEVCSELIARQLLLINVALQPPEQLGLMLKTKIFMELYGNTIVRPLVAKYLTTKGKQFVNMITNFDYMHEVMKIVDLRNLQYKERDYLEVLFKYWCAPDPFRICELWDRRLRQLLGVRYDSRMGVFDWDLHMSLHSAGATQLCPQEYKHWRDTGVAFTWLESEVSKPNRTLVAGVVPSGEQFVHHGYLGDIVTGPFIAYGLHCNDKEMLKKTNNMNVNRATDITEYNLMQIFHGILNKEECDYKSSSNIKMGTVHVDFPEKRIVDNEMSHTDDVKHSESKCVDVENVTINFLSYKMLEYLQHKEQFKELFNIIYFSNILVEKIDSNVINTVSSLNCLLIVENQNYIPKNRKEQLDELASKISSKISSLDNVTELPFNPKQDCYAMFVIT